jgi:hypothetical protein
VLETGNRFENANQSQFSCQSFAPDAYEDQHAGFAARWSFLWSLLCSARFWWILGLSYAAVFAWNSRHWMNPDGMDYLDLANACLRGGPSMLVNGLWSPGYPALLSIVFFLFRASAASEFALAHFTNFLLFTLSLWSFSVFFRAWARLALGEEVSRTGEQCYLIPFAYCTFLWFTLRLVGVENVTPDLGVVAAIFLAGAMACRLFLPGPVWKYSVALGAVIGIGYYLKAIVLPAGAILLAVLFFQRGAGLGQKKRFVLVLISFLTMLVITAPLAVSLSRQEKMLSFGDAGRLNYLWHVNKLPPSYIQENQSNPEVEHPLQVLSMTPLTWEFAQPVTGTYPLSYDPSYLWAGVKPRFDLRQQIDEMGESLSAYKEIVLEDSIPFFTGFLVLALLGAAAQRDRAAPEFWWWQSVWPLAVCLLYSLVHTEPRYLSPFLAFFFLTAYPALAVRAGRRTAIAIGGTVLLTVMIPFTVHLANVCVAIVKDRMHPVTPAYESAAIGLRQLGLKPGDRLAVVGSPYDAYYAHYDRLRVIAQIPDQDEFWRLSEPELQALSARLTTIGVNAIVATGRPYISAPADWRNVNGSNVGVLNVLLLPPEPVQSR